MEHFIVKVPRGTVVKVEGHPIQLKSSWYIQTNSKEFQIEKHIILEADRVDDER